MRIIPAPRPTRAARLVLAGDVGGTKTLIGLFRAHAEGVTPWRCTAYASGAYESLEDIAGRFLAANGAPRIAAACFGVAGPILGGATRLTNLPWRLAERDLSVALGIPRVRLLNDVQAAAFGMLHMGERAFAVVKRGRTEPERRRWPAATMAVIAPGTGLGEAMLYWDGARHIPMASEGGHAGFAPRGKMEIEFLKWLGRTYGAHVSCERIVSGAGLAALYEFLRRRARGCEPRSIARARVAGDLAAAVGAAGIARRDAVAVRALEMFAAILGAEASSLALRFFATGGVLIGGGIAPKILPALRCRAFADAFMDKGRFAPFLRDIPVRVAKDPRATLFGAARFAADAAIGGGGANARGPD
jgi:glucokinase